MLTLSVPLLPSWVSAPSPSLGPVFLPPLLGTVPLPPLLGQRPFPLSWVSVPSPSLGSVPLPPLLGQCPFSPSWVSVSSPSLGNEAMFVAKKLQGTFPFNLC